MTPQERQVLADLFERIRSAAANPRDAEAEAFIAEQVRAQPYAPYLLAQTALVQQHALDAAAQRIQELETKAAPAQEAGFLGNLGRSLFGGGQPAPRPGYDAGAYQRAAAPPPPAAPAYAPPPSGPWGASPAPVGGGFLSGALTAATGVAGGLLAANAIESLLGGGRGGGLFGGYGGGFGGAGFGGGLGGGETVINNIYEAPPDAGVRDVDSTSSGAGFQDAGDFSDGGFDDNGGFDDGGSGGSFDT